MSEPKCKPLRLSWFRWSNARGIANSRLPQVSAFIPTIGYAMLWSREFSEWIGSHEKLGDGMLIRSLDVRLQLLWWGALLMTAGWMIYLWKCPTLIKRCPEVDDYLLEQFQIRSTKFINQLSAKVADYFKDFHPMETRKLFWGCVSPNQIYLATQRYPFSGGDAFQPEFADSAAVILLADYELTNHEKPTIRTVSVVMLAVGALMFLLPSFDVCLRVIRKLMWPG